MRGDPFPGRWLRPLRPQGIRFSSIAAGPNQGQPPVWASCGKREEGMRRRRWDNHCKSGGKSSVGRWAVISEEWMRVIEALIIQIQRIVP